MSESIITDVYVGKYVLVQLVDETVELLILIAYLQTYQSYIGYHFSLCRFAYSSLLLHIIIFNSIFPFFW